MQAYKFETRISKTGKIRLPLHPRLFDKDVEIIIVPKQTNELSIPDVSDFITKWSGFLTDANTDDLKYQYLTEKHK